MGGNSDAGGKEGEVWKDKTGKKLYKYNGTTYNVSSPWALPKAVIANVLNFKTTEDEKRKAFQKLRNDAKRAGEPLPLMSEGDVLNLQSVHGLDPDRDGNLFEVRSLILYIDE